MNIEETLHDLLSEILTKLGTDFTKITVEEEENKNFAINIESDNPSILIGYHGDNIQALQHILKVLAWRKLQNEQFNIMVDIDNYRKRQENNVLALAERKIDTLRKTGRKQVLPPMSSYFRRKVHLMCMESGFEDIETYSEGQGDRRQIIIKLKS